MNYLYSASLVARARAGVCPATQNQRESIEQLIHSFINNSVLPSIRGHEACGCGGLGWKRAAYLNMSDPTQTCPPAWELIVTPRRSCARPIGVTCFSAMYTTQGIQYSHVCGRIIGYQVGQTQAFVFENHQQVSPQNIDGPYVDGVSLTYGNPR